ncbi:VacJ family lipoprotein [Mycetohabitans sp. B5]|uniref:Phospholipid-binding lipoprotein MlaA n=1 Tax=Mycetohabitans endofungorum TaxID=417203 RepID=A0A2P5K971_9BURK|nr:MULTISPECIES: VacJ family lipoprotein [Mycetohabitans]MCG1054184.1 VacJ family lipoprotein [Mycetohabitans sp. B5]PPB83261.1 phospholipid-binding lipoprotein MlaA [Mycetohabitans endofungorum]
MITMRATVVVVAVAAAMALGGCATVKTPSKQDPLEGFNRTMFEFNDTLDRVAMKPVARAYNWALPQFVRDRVSSFFSNIGDVYIAANNLLQGKITAGTEDIMRVAINSTFGLGGLFDFASQARLPKHQSDFGVTLGHYGVPPGPYLVLPLLGPNTVRDAAGLLVDWQGDLTAYMRPIWLRTTLYGVRIVSTRAALLGATDLLSNAALDKYSFVRNAHLQRRQYLISDGNPPPPAYDDESDADTGPTDDGAPAPDAEGAPAAGAGPTHPAATRPPVPAAAPQPDAAQGASAPQRQELTGAVGPDAAAARLASETHVPSQQMIPPGGRPYSIPNLRFR